MATFLAIKSDPGLIKFVYMTCLQISRRGAVKQFDSKMELMYCLLKKIWTKKISSKEIVAGCF